MKINKRKILWTGILALISLFTLISFNTDTVSADLTDSTDLAVLKDAPSGITIKKYLSNTAPTVADSTDIYNTNSAQIVNRSGVNSDDGDVLSLASAHNTYGSMWSNTKTFDINKSQTISAWLYFGNGSGSDAINSEGIAFVLQNDSHGIGALGAGLEGMGVYGYDASKINLFSGTNASQSYIQKTAIQNSVALEFDTASNNFYKADKPLNNNQVSFPNLNSSYSLGGYDTQLGTSTSNLTALGFPDTAKYGAGGSYGHIALTYPGLANSYQSTSFSAMSTTSQNTLSPFTSGFVLVHDSAKSAYLVDDTDSSGNEIYWHHVTIKWTPAPSGSTTGTLTYSYNDKSTDGTNNTNTTKQNFQKVSNTINVDTTKLASSDGLVRWGFTAANGASTSVASKLVVFDSIPELVTADVSTSIIDNTLNGKTITDDSTDNTVASGDDLTLKYNLNYVRGTEDWKDIAAKIKIPDNLTITPDSSGNVAYITYADGSTEAISSSDLSGSSLSYTLAKTIGTSSSSAGSSATIKISATAKNTTTSDIDVGTAAATFSGSNEISTTNTPKFTILAPKSYTLNLANSASSSDLTLLYKQTNATLNLPTTLNYSDNHSFGDSSAGTNIVYQITVNGKTYTVGSNATDTKYDLTMDLKSIIDDDDAFWNIFTENSTKTVEVKAIDQTNGLISNTLTYNVSTKPNQSLSMTVTPSLQFQDINYSTNATYLQRKTDFNLSVTSLREPWQLSATTNGLYLNGETLDSNFTLVYKPSSSSKYYDLSTTPTAIESDTTSHESSSTENISDSWTKTDGLLLKQSGTYTAGQYTGTVGWELTDSITNT